MGNDILRRGQRTDTARAQVPGRARGPAEALLAGSCLGLMLALGTPVAFADEPGFALTLPLVLNGRYLGDLAGEVFMDGSASVEYERMVALLARHLDESALRTLRANAPEADWFPVSATSTPPLEIEYAAAELAIHVEAPHEAFAPRNLAIAGSGQPDPRDFRTPANASAALDMVYNQEYLHRSPEGSRGRLPATALLETRGNLGGRDGLNFAAAGIYAEGADQRWQRREARLFHDDTATATRYTFGDLVPPAHGFQQNPRLAGIGISRIYGEIQPYRNIRSSGQREVVLERPSTVDVEVDGVVVRTEQLAPGRYQLTDFPLAIGSNEVRLLVEDDLGRREAARFDPYHHPELLSPGTRQFDASIGRLQDTDRVGRPRYSNDHAFTGFLEQGWKERATVSADLQFSESGYHSTGFGIRGGHPAGITAAQLSRSGFHSGGGNGGYALGLAHQWNRSPAAEIPVNIGVHADYFQNDYRSLVTADGAAGRRLSTGARAQVRLPGGWSTGIGIQRQDSHDDTPALTRQDLSLSRGFSGRGNLFAGIQRSSGGVDLVDGDRYSASVGLSWQMGDRGLVRSQYQTRDQRSRVQAQRLGGRGIHDISARASLNRSDTSEELDAGLRYRGNRANVELQGRGAGPSGWSSPEESRSALRVATGLAWADGHVGIAPRVGNGFAVYRPHESLRDHPLTITDGGGRRVRARSDFLGPPTVALQRPYVPETLDTGVRDLPLGYDLGAQREALLPGAFNGYVIPVGSADARTVLGYLVDPEGETFPQLTGHLVRVSDGERLPLFTNRIGRFVAERVAPGEYRVVLGRWESRDTLIITSDSESLIDAGTLEMH